MSSLSAELTTAYLFVTRCLISNSIVRPKDLDGFLSVTKEMMANIASMKIDSASISLSSQCCPNKELIDEKPMINEVDKAYREKTKIITNFIIDSDRNKIFLNNYIKYIYAYIYDYSDKEENKIINKHPHLSSPVFSYMFCTPIFLIGDTTITAYHIYHTVDKVALFWIKIIAGDSMTIKNVDICLDSLLDITFDNIVSVMEQGAIMSAIEKLTKEYTLSFQEDKRSYILNYPINKEFTLSLYLPKAYFRFKR